MSCQLAIYPRRHGKIEKASMRELTHLSLPSRNYETALEGFLVVEVDGKVAGFGISNVRETFQGDPVDRG